MNQCLKDLPSDEAFPAGEALSPGGSAPTCDGKDRVQGEARPATSVKGRVLLLDDDPDFKDIIRGFLAESGYTVVAVQNGAQGIREVLAGDFALILCDMRMPTVPGDVFYRAVERVRPHLCRRFVFMTGSRGEADTHDFIESVSGFLIRKPFHLNDLLNSISVIEVCGSFQSVFEPSPASVLPGICEQADPRMPTVAQLQASMIAAERQEPRPVEKPDPRSPIEADEARRRPSHMLPAGKPRRSATPDSPVGAPGGLAPSRVFLKIRAGVVLAIFVALTSAFVVGWHQHLDDRYNALSAELSAAERERDAILKELLGAERARKSFQVLLSAPKRIEDDRTAPRWTKVLSDVATSRERDIELQGIHARQMVGTPGACELRIDGVSFGPSAAMTVERFRLKMEQELQRDHRETPVKTGYLRFADEPDSPSAPANQPRITFEIVATVGIKNPALLQRALRF